MTNRNLSRRGFLSAAAACAAPLFLPARVLGKDGNYAPNDIINVALVGCGWRRSNVGSRPGSRFCAYCDVDTRRLPQETADVKAFQYFEDLLQMPGLDVVSIATPDHWHTKMTVDACKAGKDVYCEKPLTFTLMESRLIVAAARKYNRVVSSGSQRVYEDYGQFMAPIIMSGAIGEIKEIYAGCAGSPGERVYPAQECPKELDWDRWLGQAPWFPYNEEAIRPMTWRFNSAFGTGGLGDWGGHNFGGALYSCGMDGVAPVKAFAPNTEQNPHGGAMILMENGVKFFHNSPRGSIMLVGTEGTYVHKQTPEIKARHAVNVRRYSGGANNIADDFLFCVRNRIRPFQDVFYGANVSDYGHLCNVVYKLKRDVTWDKDKMEFVGDEEATKLARKIQRAPYTIEL